MKRILVMGYNSNHNFGDKFISDCVVHIIEKELGQKAKEADFETKMSPITIMLFGFLIILSKIVNNQEWSDRLVYLAVKIRCKRDYRKQMEGCDAVIFGCGSFKYGTQKLWAYYSCAIEIAKEKNLCVMFDGMNVQKYNGTDWKCLCLQKHAMYSNVRVITSRDGEFGVKRLRKDYQIPDSIVCAGVGDPAFWIPDCYGVKKNNESELVGINLIAGNIFQRYGSSDCIGEQELLQIYCKILLMLDEKNIKWQLFTNGLKVDYEFGQKLRKLYGNESIDIRHPDMTKDLLEIISSYRTIFGARLHACICAYSLDIPVVGFYWDEKLLHFSEMAEIENCFFSEKQMNAGKIGKRLIENYMDNKSFNLENRMYWKNRTKEYIEYFINSI